MSDEAHILLTNDDGIRSPGLWAAAEALAHIGYVNVVAPREQWSGAGRSMPSHSEGRIHPEEVVVHGKRWTVYALDGTPAQAVQHALLEIVERRPDLVVAGINYGENVGGGVTISGTVGAALEAASFDIPAMAVSFEVDKSLHLSHSTEVDFSAAAHFTEKFARMLLRMPRPGDLDVLKVEVPASATPATRWQITRLSRQRYYLPTKPAREHLGQQARIDYNREFDVASLEPDSDVYALAVGRVVSVTPLSLDLTSRLDLAELERMLRNGAVRPGLRPVSAEPERR